VSTLLANNAQSLSEFRNEPYADFSRSEVRAEALKAAELVRSRFGGESELLIGGKHFRTESKLRSLNPSRPSEVVGTHQRASPEQAAAAVEAAWEYFPTWAAIPASERIGMLRRAAVILRRRKMEMDAWQVFEAGKTWPEAEADVSEAIDFCEYYALQMERFAGPQPVSQLPGEQARLVYLPLGVGVVVPPWNFPLAILAGMTTAALVAGNTVVLKPSSDTPTIAARFVEVLLEAGFPDRSFCFVTGSGSAVGDVLVSHPKTRFIAFTGSMEVGLHINELAARPQKGQIWIKRVIAEMGGKDAIIVDDEADLDAAVDGVLVSAFGYQGQKCSACSRAIVSEKVYEPFLKKLTSRVAGLKVGAADDFANYMGPVINDGARKSILRYIEAGKQEGQLVAGGAAASGEGYFIQPTVIAGVDSKATIFQEEIFGPVLAVTRAADFEDALRLANDTRFGLTGAVYTRNPEKIAKTRDQFFVGNLYINRKCTGAMVGAHPFGGFNMSGTDSKAGGPDYLLQFLQAKSIAEKTP